MHEAALCLTGIRHQRALSQRGFELLNGLPFLASDTAIHHLLDDHMTLALVTQAVISQLRQRLGELVADWDASRLAQAIVQGIEGDLRVSGETILVTCYNAPHVERLREHYKGLPAKLEDKHLDPRIPWLYNFKLDFRFR